jgi:hypothetical protein
MLLHAAKSDYLLNAESHVKGDEVEGLTGPDYLTDPSGNRLTDPSGNYLIAYSSSGTISPILLHAAKYDYNLNAE